MPRPHWTAHCNSHARSVGRQSSALSLLLSCYPPANVLLVSDPITDTVLGHYPAHMSCHRSCRRCTTLPLDTHAPLCCRQPTWYRANNSRSRRRRARSHLVSERAPECRAQVQDTRARRAGNAFCSSLSTTNLRYRVARARPRGGIDGNALMSRRESQQPNNSMFARRR